MAYDMPPPAPSQAITVTTSMMRVGRSTTMPIASTAFAINQR